MNSIPDQTKNPTTAHSGGDGYGSVLDWAWPVAPTTLPIYDKYTDTNYIIHSEEDTWRFSYKGNVESIVFASGSTGSLQRRLALLISGRSSPGTLHRTGRLLVQKWDIVVALLHTRPENIKATWDEYVDTIPLAGTYKNVLKLACTANVGHWSGRATPVVNSLDTRANSEVARHTGNIETRQHLINVHLHAGIIKALDAAACITDLSTIQLEGAAALLLIYQHGVRPIQVLCLNVQHVRFFKDASNETACVASFHAAKQKNGETFEIVRQIKPEWVPIIARLHTIAVNSGRSRLFDTSTSSLLWYRAKTLCKLFNVELTCTAPHLRHTAAQALADAGHTRESIQQFLGHTGIASAAVYVRASLQQTQLINSALGASKLYNKIHGIAYRKFVTLEEMLNSDEDQQIGGIVGESLVGGIGLCRSGQSHCNYNPVTSCYGCAKFMPSLDRDAHRDAVEGMRQQVRVYLARGVRPENPAYLQLTRALSGAQQALDAIEELHLRKQ
ncbi:MULTISPECIES: site-specific integrase [Pseudomonas]|jgi:hypothetical protein|uniref:site-specific integrase n=1 Tax=Pseudomonas TaxID=286 RepID=UPI000343165A|nr:MULTISPECIES: site-specific integrase [Pseudomonas]EPA96096.1 hypothetical protein PG5_33360 [Pseudomonas sp. G5(2012)]NWL19351.1 site-specific integrase [Pseudomonas umsongensis]